MTPIQLWTRNRKHARTVARRFFLPGADRCDVEQEADIGLWVAARQYEEGHGSSFKHYATIIIERRLVQCVQAANRQKHQTLNLSVRETNEENVTNLLPHLHQVSDRCEEREQVRALLAAIASLTEWEQRCVLGVASGLTYAEIGGPTKRIDNTLQAARRKLRAV